MKQKTFRVLTVILFAAATFGCGSVQSAKSPTRHEARQEEAILALMAAWNGGPVDGVEQYGAATIAFHYRGQTMTTNFDELRGLISHWREAFPDFRMHVDEIITEENVTAVRMRYEGTHEGVWFGNEPTGKRVLVDEMMFFRFEDGLLVEAWEVDDQLTMRQQLGLIP